jgi:hypothetical protein
MSTVSSVQTMTEESVLALIALSKPKKKKVELVLPDYFEQSTDLSMLRQCLVTVGEGNKITHLTTVPFHLVNYDDPKCFVALSKYPLTLLRKIVIKFEPGRRRKVK